MPVFYFSFQFHGLILNNESDTREGNGVMGHCRTEFSLCSQYKATLTKDLHNIYKWN